MNITLAITDEHLKLVDEYNAAMKVAVEVEATDPKFQVAVDELTKAREALSIVMVVAINVERFHEACREAAAGKLDISDCEEMMVMDVDSRDYPDFCDAAWESGYHKILERELTEDELAYMGENHPEDLNEAAMESLR